MRTTPQLESFGFLYDGWRLQVRPGAPALAPPCWVIDEIFVPSDPVKWPRREAWNEHSVGSMYGINDEWRFDLGTRVLGSLVWRVPERNEIFDAAWSGAPEHEGEVVLVEMDPAAERPLQVRMLSEASLICTFPETPRARATVRIAPTLSVLVGDGRYWGWMLDRPFDHLPQMAATPAVVSLVQEYFRLVSADTISALSAQSEDLRVALAGLAQSARSLRSLDGDLLAKRIGAIFECFYS